MAHRLDYGNMMHRAMRGLIAEVLEIVARDGLPGEHHFFITFDTRHPDVGLSDWLRDRYPEEMTIVLQHWFDGLEVTEDGFSVTLNFGDQPEPLRIPFDAVRTFVDPSVEFGLRFEEHEAEDDDSSEGAASEPPPIAEVTPIAKNDDTEAPAASGEGEVVSLDKFRK